MDMRIGSLTSSALGGVTAGAGAAGRLQRAGGDSGTPAVGGFSDAFKSALQNVSAAQQKASDLQTEVQMGNPSVSLEETMLAMQKAQVGFQAALHVRNRMMQAYTDVMNMQV